jgi:hypothetical protein
MNDELYHYGVKGMKWGVRRYQRKDGSLTSAGKKKARQEYRADNKEAYELGKKATILGYAAGESMKRSIKLKNKVDKRHVDDPLSTTRRTQSLENKLQASTKTSQQLLQEYRTNAIKAEKHCKKLVDKYGDQAVRPIQYKDLKLTNRPKLGFRTMDERTNKWYDWAVSGATSVASVGLSTMFNLPVAAVYMPATTRRQARSVEQDVYMTNRMNAR